MEALVRVCLIRRTYWGFFQLHTFLLDKRGNINFHISNFPFLSSNISSLHAYGVFILQLIRNTPVCSCYEWLILRATRLHLDSFQWDFAFPVLSFSMCTKTSTSWVCRFGTWRIVRHGEWRIFVNYSVFSALFPLKLRVFFEQGILGTPVLKILYHPYSYRITIDENPIPLQRIFVLSYLCLLLTKVLFETSLKSFPYNTEGRYIYQSIQSNWFCVHIIVQGVKGCVKIKSMNLTNIQGEVTFAPHIWP